MTISEFWRSWLGIGVLVGPYLLAVVGISFGLYLSYFQMDAIRAALKNSRFIYIWGPSLGRRGLIWSILEMGRIHGMLIWPKGFIRIGELDASDYENYPPRLWMFLKIHVGLMFVAGVWFAVVCFIIESGWV